MQLEDLFLLLKDLSEGVFEQLISKFVDRIEICTTIHLGRGLLCLNMKSSEKPKQGKIFFVQVSAHDELKKQEFVFIHEVIHIALILKGFADESCGNVSDVIYNYIEREIDCITTVLCDAYPELIHKYFTNLVR